MKPDKYLIILLTTLIIVGVLIAVAGFVRYRFNRNKYEEYLFAEQKAIPMFDKLNDQVAQNLPPLPQGSSLEEKRSGGIDSPLYEHGRWLEIKVSTDKEPDFILEYYRSSLTNSGWQENTRRHAVNDDFYFKGTGCIQITPPSNIYPHYTLTIWHDYKQNFDSDIPDPKIISSFEWSETTFAICP